MTRRLRIGILGTGNIARQFAEGVRTGPGGGSERCEVVSVGSRSGESAVAFARAHGIAKPHASYEAVLRDPEVEAVYVSLPNTLHHRWALEALRARKHVLCEKPLTPTAAEAEELFDAAEKAGRVLIEAFMYRTHPMMLEVVAQVRSGAVGKVKLLRASFCYATKNIASNIRFRPDLCGGSLMDIGCYCVDFGRLMTGEDPAAVAVSAHRHESGVDDFAAGTLTYPGGTTLSFCCGQTVQMNNVAFIGGDAGYIEIPVPWKPPVEGAVYALKRQTPPRQDALPGTGSRETAAAPTPGATAEGPRRVDAGKPLYGMEADAFADAVLDGTPPFMTREDSVSNARVLERLRAAAGLPY